MSARAATGVTHLDPHDCWARLRTSAVGRIAFAGPDGPELLPVNVVVDQGAVVLRVGATSALAAAAGARVALEADGVDADGGAWSVVLKGPLELIRRMHDLVASVGLPLFPWHAEPKPRFLRLVPTEVTGRRFVVVGPAHWEVDAHR